MTTLVTIGRALEPRGFYEGHIMDPYTAIAFSLANLLIRALQMKSDADSGKQPTPDDLNALKAETQSLHDQAHALLPGAPAEPPPATGGNA